MSELSGVEETTSMLRPDPSVIPRTGISLVPPIPPESKSEARVTLALNLSWWSNLLLLGVKIFAYMVSDSKSILASLIDSIVDIISQTIVTLAMKILKKPNEEFPIGRTRLEALSVICCACIMSVAAVEVIQECITGMEEGWGQGIYPHIEFGGWPIGLLAGTTVLKVILYVYCYPLQKLSDGMKAVTEDHLNDIMSNTIALLAALVARYVPNNAAWWVDPVGGLVISLWIIWRWLGMVKEQVDKLVGKSAPPEFVQKVESVVQTHHEKVELDVVRVYYSGSRFVVEVEVVMPWDMNLLTSHDICLNLQHKIEALEEVERCHVHADYMKRDAPEHKPEREVGLTYRKRPEDDANTTDGIRQRQPAPTQPQFEGA
jgi:cation diffusion facilitator family transporter